MAVVRAEVDKKTNLPICVSFFVSKLHDFEVRDKFLFVVLTRFSRRDKLSRKMSPAVTLRQRPYRPHGVPVAYRAVLWLAVRADLSPYRPSFVTGRAQDSPAAADDLYGAGPTPVLGWICPGRLIFSGIPMWTRRHR